MSVHYCTQALHERAFTSGLVGRTFSGMKTFRAVMLKGKGGLDRLETVELPLADPGPGELRVKVRASGAGSTDIMMRTGYYPYRPRFPFVQGYEVVGDVDAIGEGVEGFRVGQRVAALTVFGGWGEYLVRSADDFVPVPEGLDDADVVALILNYATAYQAIHRFTDLKKGDTALVSGANGGCGTALLELLREIGVRAIGSASERHWDDVRALGGEPIAARSRPLDVLVHAIAPDGVDAAFDVLGGAATAEHVRATKKGGTVVGYGFMAAKSALESARGFASLYAAPLAGRKGTFYGITRIYRKDKRPFKEDLPKLFELLGKRAIAPKIAARLPLLEGKEAQRMLEKGGVVGKIVLLA
jgi:NADPH2:quinone reductase